MWYKTGLAQASNFQPSFTLETLFLPFDDLYDLK
jgi:hypothetical protein